MQLRAYQKSAAESVVNWFRYKDTPAIVVIPTGGGKSLVIKALAEHFAILSQRVLILAHRKELLEQTGEKIQHESIGYYSASIGEKRLDCMITIANIQSIFRAPELPPFNVVLADECHMIDNNGDDSDSMYWQTMRRLPDAKLAGFTATPYRLKGGKLSWGEVVYDISYGALLQDGYLCPLTNKMPQDLQPNLSAVEVKLGEFVTSQLEEVMEDAAMLEASIKAMVAYSIGRNSCLIFVVSLKHGELVLDAMHNNGMSNVAMVSSETPSDERERIIESFKAQRIRFLINCELLLVGFDAPCVDAIFCLRPTKSKGLWEQLCGRGVRLFDGKQNCLLVDMAGNLREHGALGTPSHEKAKREKSASHGKICPECEEFVKPLAKECSDCGYLFPEAEQAKVSHDYEPDTQSSATLAGDICSYDVSDVLYREHKGKNGKPNTLRIDYVCGYGKYGSISEWYSVAPEASDWAKQKAQNLFKARGHELGSPVDTYSFEDLLWKAEHLKKPTRITVDHAGEFPRIIRCEFEEDKKPVELDDKIVW